jgi:hypothetical protein
MQRNVTARRTFTPALRVDAPKGFRAIVCRFSL